MNSTPLLTSLRKQTIARHFTQANEYKKHAKVQAKICELLAQKVIRNCDSILEVGAGQGLLTKHLATITTAKHWYINELCAQHHQYLQPIVPTAIFYFGDAEGLLFLEQEDGAELHQAKQDRTKQKKPEQEKTEQKIVNQSEKFDLIASGSSVQWFDNPLGFIDDAIKHLTPNGQLLFNSFTPNNFYQIKQLTGQGLNYPTINQWQAKLDECLNSGYLQQAELSIHRYVEVFDTPIDVLKHIKNTGVSVNLNSKYEHGFRWNRKSLRAFEDAYKTQFSNNTGQVRLSYETVVINAIKA